MGTLANHGRDKLTVVTSPAISSFGLWVEQLIAESTGKESTGIVPIAGEPLAEPSHYGDDRLFVYLRLESDDNQHIDTAMDAIGGSGQPVVQLGLKDRYDLGGEFFRWELATAVAGSLIGIHPFDQPDVQAAKDSTERLLKDYQATGVLPELDGQGSLKSLLAQAKSGEYLAIMAYLGQTPEIDLALTDLRRKAMERYGIATTLGYGPRFLHSTGQLHKGGPKSGYFLQLVMDHGDDLPIPGKPYSFGVLADAQALGDMQALQASGRRVARIQVGRDGVASIRVLIDELG
jgi:glucose-6-phosphate isomerase/transaldolase/glucose-6-phosphate isomerase